MRQEEAPQASSKASSRSAQPDSADDEHAFTIWLSWPSLLPESILSGPTPPGLGNQEDMTQTLQQEQLLRDEIPRLKAQYDKLNDPDEISREAREQFGLAKLTKSLISRKVCRIFHFGNEFLGDYEYNDIYVYQLC